MLPSLGAVMGMQASRSSAPSTFPDLFIIQLSDGWLSCAVAHAVGLSSRSAQ